MAQMAKMVLLDFQGSQDPKEKQGYQEVQGHQVCQAFQG